MFQLTKTVQICVKHSRHTIIRVEGVVLEKIDAYNQIFFFQMFSPFLVPGAPMIQLIATVHIYEQPLQHNLSYAGDGEHGFRGTYIYRNTHEAYYFNVINRLVYCST